MSAAAAITIVVVATAHQDDMTSDRAAHFAIGKEAHLRSNIGEGATCFQCQMAMIHDGRDHDESSTHSTDLVQGCVLQHGDSYRRHICQSRERSKGVLRQPGGRQIV